MQYFLLNGKNEINIYFKIPYNIVLPNYNLIEQTQMWKDAFIGLKLLMI